jgi:hypothetical protein
MLHSSQVCESIVSCHIMALKLQCTLTCEWTCVCGVCACTHVRVRVLDMLDKWLTKYPRPFIRASSLTPTAPPPSALRIQLKDFLNRASATPCSCSSSQASWFEKKLASLHANLESLATDEECSEFHGEEDLDDTLQVSRELQSIEDSDALLARYQALLKVRRAIVTSVSSFAGFVLTGRSVDRHRRAGAAAHCALSRDVQANHARGYPGNFKRTNTGATALAETSTASPQHSSRHQTLKLCTCPMNLGDTTWSRVW